MHAWLCMLCVSEQKGEDEMKWLRLTLFGVTSILLISQNVARAQSFTEPIKAKQRTLSYRIQPDGSKVLRHEHSGMFYRASSGASMNTVDDRSTFTDTQGDAYEINHTKKFAKLVAHQPPPHEFIKNTKPESIQGYEAVNGFSCAVLPVLLNGKLAGKEYLYLPYGLWVKTQFTSPEGLLMIRELYDIQVVEPDAALVRIPEGYLIDKNLQ